MKTNRIINHLIWLYEVVQYTYKYSEYTHKLQGGTIIEVGNNFWPQNKKWLWEVKVNGKKININNDGTGTSKTNAFNIATKIIKGLNKKGTNIYFNYA